MILWTYTLLMSLFALFIFMFGALGYLLVLAFTFGVYLFFSYVFARIGRKFGVGSFAQYLIPIWNAVLLCDCAKISRWVAAAVVLPTFSGMLGAGFLGSVVSIAAFAANVYLWGKIAERLGKNFWLWGIITPLLGWLPSIVLAFDGSRPSAGADSPGKSQGVRYIDL